MDCKLRKNLFLVAFKEAHPTRIGEPKEEHEIGKTHRLGRPPTVVTACYNA